MPPPPRERGRSRSPGSARRPYMPPVDDYDRRGPSRPGPGAGAYSPPRRDGAAYAYRDRSPRRDYYDDRSRYRSPPPPPPPRRPMDDYPHPRGRHEDPYRRDYAPAPAEPYTNGRPYDRPPRDFAQREAAYAPRENFSRDYDRGRYW